MRILRLIGNIVSLPVVVILVIVAALGNLTTLADVFPQTQEMVTALTSSAVAGPVLVWLSQANFQNWFILFLLVALVGVIERSARSLSAHYWPKPSIELTPTVETKTGPEGEASYARLIARNTEKQIITDCAATLETAANLGASQQAPMTRIRNNRLQWAEEQIQDNECAVTLNPGTDGLSIAVADTTGGFHFSACKPSNLGRGMLGLYLVKIMVGGKMRSGPIKPQIFDGYLYVADTGKGATQTILFGQGDWTKDRRIPSPRHLRIGSWRIKLPWR